MRRIFALVCLVMTAAVVSAASDSEYRDAILTLYSRASFGALTRDWCDAKAPQLKAQSAKAFQTWWLEQGLAEVETRVKAVYSADQLAALNTRVEGVRRGTYTKLDQLFPDATARCQDLRGYYNEYLNLRQDNADQYTIMASRALPTSSTANTPAAPSSPAPSSTVPSSPVASTQTVAGVLYTVPQLNTLIIKTLAAVKGSRSDGEKAVLEKLQSLGTVFITGVALDESRLGYQQGKFKSKYSVFCPSSFKGEFGKTFVITGKVEKFNYGWLELTGRCQRVEGTSGLKRSNLPDNLGLERKPLTAQEVRTKPGGGVSLSAIEGVYFKQTVQNRMDGFGNIYVDRNEDTYLLLKDGSAYSYDWSFTPQDFNAAYSKLEEPKNWERWTRENGEYELKDSAGSRTDLSDFSKILALPKGSRLGRSYDYLTVNASSQRSSLLTFKADGSFVTTNSTPLAGGLVVDGTVYSTPPASSETKGRYEIDGYTLTFKTVDGRVSRIFFGVPEFEKNAKNPEWIFFSGLLYGA